MSVEFLDCLKRERDISIKAMSSGGKMAFRLTPPLNQHVFLKIRINLAFNDPATGGVNGLEIKLTMVNEN